MKWKRTKKRRKKRQIKKTLLKFKPLLALVLFVIAVYSLASGSELLLQKSGFFTVSAVEISGNKYISKKNIQAIANIDTNQSMYSVKLTAISEALLRNQYIRGVSVTRGLPSTIHIDVQEREPFLYLVDKSIYMVDETGLILEKIPGMPMGKAPFITGISRKEMQKDSTILSSAIQLVRKIREVDESLLPLISEVHIRKNRAPELILIKGGAHVKIGDSKHYQRLFLLSQFLRKQPIINKLKKIKSVDLTFRNRIVINHKS